MRRDMGKNLKEELNIKIIKYSAIVVAILTIIVFAVLIYCKNINNEVKEEMLASEQMSSILKNTNSTENTESASSEIGKSVNEMANELNEKNNITNSANSSKNAESKSNNVLTTNKIKENTTTQTNGKAEEKKETKKVEINFEKPLEGEIIKDFAVDSLVYSNTLQEWTTHTGIDIKADKTTVVKSAEAGIVKTIKNDPRYGLTITVEHENGFQTVYSNLLTSEFVVEGEKVERGQSLGTVGNTAAFEIAEESHLHFEILKDSIQVDPNIYLK